jgi:branched-chain amino acid transport system ATP-binding protein
VSALEVDRVEIAFGGVRALRGVSFTVREGEVFALIGPNGAGKTTLFNCISGLYRPTGGRLRLLGHDVTGLPPEALAARGLSRTFQNLQIFQRMTAAENVMAGRHLKESRSALAHMFALPARSRDNRASRAAALGLLAQVGLAADADRPAGALPYGAMKRLEIARALATEPRVLLLDEPAAGCNAVEAAEIEAVLRAVAATGVTIVLVEHDMKLVMRVSDHIHVLSGGETLAEGRPEEVRAHPKVIEAYLGRHGAADAAHG